MTGKQKLKIISFLLLSGILLTMLTYCLRTNGAVKDRFLGFYAEPKNSIDVVMIGSSSVFPYYCAPQMFGEAGIVMYPLSTNLQRPIAQLYLAKEALSRQDPRLLVFELRMYTAREIDMINNMAYTRGVTDNLRYSLNRAQAVFAMVNPETRNDSVDPDADWQTYLFDIFKYHSNWRSLRLLSQWKSYRYAVPDPRKGYEGSTDVGPCDLIDFSKETGELELDEKQDLAIRNLLSFLQKEKRRALFVVSPYLEDEDTAKRLNTLERMIREAGFDYLDLNDYYEEIGLSGSDDFSDYGNHTNVAGSVKVTRFFEDWLKEHYELPDRRGEKGYGSWEAAYSRWQEESAGWTALVRQRVENKEYAGRPAQAE